jgi:trk system potassium uptake protein TrkH
LFLLTIALPDKSFELIVFEAISALGTVGLSMGLTAELNAAGKWVIIGLMYVGRLGVVTLGLLIVTAESEEKSQMDDLAV